MLNTKLITNIYSVPFIMLACLLQMGCQSTNLSNYPDGKVELRIIKKKKIKNRAIFFTG